MKNCCFGIFTRRFLGISCCKGKEKLVGWEFDDGDTYLVELDLYKAKYYNLYLVLVTWPHNPGCVRRDPTGHWSNK